MVKNFAVFMALFKMIMCAQIRKHVWIMAEVREELRSFETNDLFQQHLQIKVTFGRITQNCCYLVLHCVDTYTASDNALR